MSSETWYVLYRINRYTVENTSIDGWVIIVYYELSKPIYVYTKIKYSLSCERNDGNSYK